VAAVSAWTLDSRDYTTTAIPGPSNTTTYTVNGPDTFYSTALEVGNYPYLSIGLYIQDSCSIDSVVLEASVDGGNTFTRQYYDLAGNNTWTMLAEGITDKDTLVYFQPIPACTHIRARMYVSNADTFTVYSPVFMGP